jgi:hypothetical protein
MVTPFVNKELTDRETEQFLHHIEHCEDCMDELDIYYTVYKAFDTLDCNTHHRENDFRKLLQEEIRQTKRGILRRRVLLALRGILFVLAELLLILSVYTGYEIREKEEAHTSLQSAIHRIQRGNEE